MSYIADIKAVFKSIQPNGTFLFASEARADDEARNIESLNFPICVVDDQPLNTTIRITPDASRIDSPRLKIYFLTKFDLSNNPVDENSHTRFDQHEECIQPMKDLGARVLGIYFRIGEDVIRRDNLNPSFSVFDKYNLWSKMLYGVEFNVSGLELRQFINYCQQITADSATITADSTEVDASGGSI